jgi:hypothetical protein
VDTAPFVKGPDWWHRISGVNQKGHITTECGQTFEHVEAQAGSIDSIEQDNGCPKCVPEKAMKLATGGEIVRLQEPATSATVGRTEVHVTINNPKVPEANDELPAEEPVDDLTELKMPALTEIAKGLGIAIKPGTSKVEARRMIRAAREA